MYFLKITLKLTGAIVVGTEFKTGITMAFVRTESVETSSVVANVVIALTLVNINTRVTAGCQSVAAAADALE